jgi:hypothetical protein
LHAAPLLLACCPLAALPLYPSRHGGTPVSPQCTAGGACAAPGPLLTWLRLRHRFELPAFYLAHSINAWYDPLDGCVHLLGNCIETSMVDLDWARRDGTFPDDLRPLLHDVVLEPGSGRASRRQMSEVVGDLPSMHPGLVGRKNRCAAQAGGGLWCSQLLWLCL